MVIVIVVVVVVVEVVVVVVVVVYGFIGYQGSCSINLGVLSVNNSITHTKKFKKTSFLILLIMGILLVC